MRIDDHSRVVVTGPTGAVGNALIDELMSVGASITAICRRGSSRLASIQDKPNTNIVECNLSEYARLPMMLDGNYDVFYHLAWAGTSGKARQDWPLQARNATAAVEAAKAAATLGCKVFVGVGSQAEYGHVDGKMHPEGACKPVTGYGASKLAAKEMTQAFCRHVGMRHAWCRILSLYGPGDNENSLVMDVLLSLLRGSVPQCTPCDQLWDYIYSRDAARALRLVAERGRDGATYLIASGQTRPLKDYVNDIRDVVNPKSKIAFGARPYYANQAMMLAADISNLEGDIGFRPHYTFKQGLTELLAWVLERDAEGVGNDRS